MSETGPGPGTRSPVDLTRTSTKLGAAVPGYGLTPSSAHARAAVVRAVTSESRIQQRPYPVVLASGLVAIVALAVWAWQLILALTEEQPLSLLFWAGLAVFLVAAAICSWAWQLYDVQKAIVMWIAIVVLSLAAVLIIGLVLVALKGDSDLDVDFDLDDWLDKISGSPAGRDPVGFMADVVGPALEDVAAATQGAGGPVAPPVIGDPGFAAMTLAATATSPGSVMSPAGAEPPDPGSGSHLCAGCGRRFDVEERLSCPACGRVA